MPWPSIRGSDATRDRREQWLFVNWLEQDDQGIRPLYEALCDGIIPAGHQNGG
jgi:hypothetical protein